MTRLLLLFAVASLAACGGPQETSLMGDPVRTSVTVEVAGDTVVLEPGNDRVLLVDPSNGDVLRIDEVLEAALGVSIVYVGEEHDQPAHHDLQLAVIEALAEDGPVGVGLEMVDWRYQDALDRFDAGETNSRRLFDELEWDDNWSMDRRLYADILRAGADPNVRPLALNAPRALSSRVYEVGLDGLEPGERAQLPDEYDRSNAAYRAYLTEVLATHMDTEADDFNGAVDRFEEAQLTWDESMAETLAAAVVADPGRRWVVVAGVGHVQHRWGIPSRVTRRVDVSDLTIACAALGRDGARPSLEAQALFDDPPADVLCLTLAVE